MATFRTLSELVAASATAPGIATTSNIVADIVNDAATTRSSTTMMWKLC